MSIVEGSFFETVPKTQLLKEIGSQILASTGLDERQRESLIEPLSHLEQGDIAKSRSIENASIKPRFRIMAEAHSEGNPHRYPEIKPRTVNLILKIPSTNIERWLKEEFASIGLKPYTSHKNKGIHLELNYQGKPLTFEVFDSTQAQWRSSCNSVGVTRFGQDNASRIL